MGAIAEAAEGKTLVKANPTNDFKGLLEANMSRLQEVMPKAMSAERFFQLAVSTYNQTPQLAECSTASVFSTLMKCASLGLEPSAVDGLGRAYILPYNNRKTGRKEATFILGYKGMIDLARRSGQLKSIHAQAVYAGDSFRCWEDESGQHFTFEPDMDAEHTPDKLTNVYVNAQLKDGGFVFERMTRKEVDAVRGRSKASKTGPWVTDYEAMALKTVIRRAFKYLPVSVEAQSAAAADETDGGYVAELTPVFEAETGEAENA